MNLYNHLRNPLPSKRLTVHERLSPHPGQQVEHRGHQQEHRSRDETGRRGNQTQPLDQRHDTIDCCAHVVRLEAADEGIEPSGGRADAEKERDLDEEDYEGRDAAGLVSCWAVFGGQIGRLAGRGH